MIEARPTAYSRVTLSRIMTSQDVNLYGTVHGGVIMKFVDDAAGAAAARHCGFNAVTVSIDEIALMVPVRVGDLVHANAQVNWTGKTSLEVGVSVLAERWNEGGREPVHVASAYLVFVGVDAFGQPREVPKVLPGDESDQRRFQEAEIRRQHRLARRKAISDHRGE
ncbi:acyl-CoA thioesterase [Catelliglobosispora koreensis]|uniref:acyl-CoA thioesterase n=1 Tax=Catelliglobosispora koreensis TaxID=129052 RepID=UPI00035CAB18|nr:acyl-CoA thioesterase [Catelliglobosispora koreensis]